MSNSLKIWKYFMHEDRRLNVIAVNVDLLTVYHEMPC